MVGDRRITVSETVISNKVRQKYAKGGVADGLEVTWKKPAVPAELRALLGRGKTTSLSFSFFLFYFFFEESLLVA